jgi:muramidase (phage lysozyme)
MNPNLKAFLDMIAVSEGTAGKGDNGYNVVVGGALFQGYNDHPRKLVWIRPGLASTAAGRYQLLKRYYDAYKKQLNLPDFSPASQDLIAIQQIRERGALQDIEKGYINISIDKVKNKLDKLITAYKDAGGTVA